MTRIVLEESDWVTIASLRDLEGLRPGDAVEVRFQGWRGPYAEVTLATPGLGAFLSIFLWQDHPACEVFERESAVRLRRLDLRSPRRRLEVVSGGEVLGPARPEEPSLVERLRSSLGARPGAGNSRHLIRCLVAGPPRQGPSQHKQADEVYL